MGKIYGLSLKNKLKRQKAYYRRGIARYLKGDYTGALEDFTAVIKLNPNCAKAYLARSEVLSAQGNWKLAKWELAKWEYLAA